MKSTSRRQGLAPVLFLLAFVLCLGAARAQSTLVRLHTTQGDIDMQLLDAEAPKSVANFLAYVRANDYVDVMFHRSAKLQDGSPFVIQAGGYRWTTGNTIAAVASRGKVDNEFSAARSNLRGTVAMAKVGGDPNSATSQWFVNLANNASILDDQNGGFTVFARVTTASMAVADRIAALMVVNAGSPFGELPVVDWQTGSSIQRPNVVLVTGIEEFAPKTGLTDSDRIFNYLQAAYPAYAPADGVQSGTAQGYVYRYYPSTNSYAGTKDGQVWYLVPALGDQVGLLGSVTDWLANAAIAGF